MSTKKIFLIAIISLIILLLIIGSIVAFILFSENGNTAEQEKESLYYSIGELYCNLKDSKRIVKVNITIEIKDEELVSDFESKSFLIKHEINKIIRSKTEQEVEGSEGQLSLQKDINNKLIEIFDTQDIVNIYFAELIVQ